VEPEFWHEIWAQEKIGFHQHDFNKHMQSFIGRLGLRPGENIFVPLCGKSLDLIWLMRRGYRVTGVEISPRAVRDFFSEHRLEPRISELPDGQLFEAAGLQIFCMDFFGLEADRLPRIDAVYDRAALVALPADMRKTYAARLTSLTPPSAPILLVTLEYPETEMSGPPFPVTPHEVQDLFGTSFDIEQVYSEDCLAREPRFREKGLSRMVERVHILRKRG
jgi:thiopurine S-methyltransferase